jgi:hypothetical protein
MMYGLRGGLQVLFLWDFGHLDGYWSSRGDQLGMGCKNEI